VQQRIAIAGEAASGKDSTALILEQLYGATHVSSSDELRKYIQANGLGIADRDTMTRVAHHLRATRSASFLVDVCLEQHPEPELLVISGIYSPAEAHRVKQAGGNLWAVICRDPAQRFQRFSARSGRPENLTYEQFLAAQAKENTGQEGQQDITGITRMADSHIYNEGTWDELVLQVRAAYEQTVAATEAGPYVS
jgi:dephospho-CoA kinase